MNNIIQNLQRRKNLLQLLLKYPKREFSMLELANESKTSYATTWRTVQELDKLGIILTKKIGNITVCRLNTKSPYISEVKKSLQIMSPHRKAALLFAKNIKRLLYVKKVILFGSVAKGKEKPSSDVDIAVITTKKTEMEKVINKLVSKILESTRIKIVPLLLTEKELKEKPDFKKEVEKGRIL